MTYDKDAAALALDRYQHRPIELDDDDFMQLEILDLAEKGYVKRTAAIHALRPLQVTKSAAPVPSRAGGLDMDAFAEVIVLTIAKSLAQRDAKIEAVSQRVLELEAAAAAGRPVPA